MKFTCQDHFLSAFCTPGAKNSELLFCVSRPAPPCSSDGDHCLPALVPIALRVFFSPGPIAADIRRCGTMVMLGMGIRKGKVLVESGGITGSQNSLG